MKVSTVLTVLCLLVASAAIAHAQVSCYNNVTCSGPNTTFSTVRECCLSNNTLAYDNGTDCIPCIVYGWNQSSLEGDESSRDVQTAEIGYIKGSGGRLAVTLSFMDAPSGTPSAKSTDVMINTPSVTIPPSDFPRFLFRMSFSADSIAQEGTERAILRLALADNSGAPAGGFFISDLELVIHDRDEIVIQFDQDDYANNEVEEEMPLSVTKNLILANPVSLQILPVTVADASRLPTNLPADNITFSPNRAKIEPEDRRDFSSEVLNLTFPADEDSSEIVNQIRKTIALEDDAIDEADVEFFVILLEVTDATDPSLIILRRNVALGRISDNDQITIGFEYESYTYTEPPFERPAGLNVFLVKENNVITEQTYPLLFQMSNAAPNDSIRVATADLDYEVTIDSRVGALLFFPPDEQRLQVFTDGALGFTLFSDTEPEGTEAFQITTGPDETQPRYIPPGANSEVFANTFMIIFDDDMTTIGWVNTAFTVPEDIGTFEACYQVFVPTPQEMLNQFISMVVDTRAGTAGNNDYTPLVSAQEMFVNNAIRERCVTITIEDDNVFEETEQFSVELAESEFSAVNPQVIPNITSITIVDTTRLMIGFIEAPYQAGEDMGPMVFTVGTIGGTTLADGVEVVVSFSTVAQAPPGRELATDGSDYNGRSNVLLTFNSTARESQVPVNLIDDSVFEMEEDFTGTLTLISSSVGTGRVSIGPQTAVATIVDDEIVCQNLSALINGRIEYSPDMTAPYDEGTVATHICNTGFVLVGNVIRTCRNDSFFDGSPPTCKPVCQELGALVNGRTEYSPNTTAPYDEGTVATHICNTGFVLVGNVIRTCRNDTFFDGSAPTCEPIECEPLPSIENGFIIYGPDNAANYELGTIATYNCNFGFILDLSGGSQMRTCIDDGDGDVLGVFDRQAPICVPIECEPLPDIPNGSITYEDDMVPNYEIGTVATYMCDDGFFLVGEDERNCTAGDGTSAIGEFNGVAPTCVPIECEPLPPIANGFITYAPDNTPNYTLNTVATYACDAGFVLDLSGGGSEMRTCIDDFDNDAQGMFDRQAPSCVSIECEPLQPIANGFITYAPDDVPNYALNTVAIYACNAGFVLDLSVGSLMRTCRDDGDGDNRGIFNGTAPSCVPIECEPLPLIANGVITYGPDNTPNYALNTVATYACNAGFALNLSVGSRMRTCIDDGDGDDRGIFNGTAPSCVPIECEPLPIIANGSITYSPDNTSNYELGTVATYTCNAGFALDLSGGGSRMRECIDDGNGDALGVFNRQAPTCIPIECEPLPLISNGFITYSPDNTPNYALGTNATYVCNAGFTLDLSGGGSQMRTCIDDGDGDTRGVFDRQAPTCRADASRVNDTATGDPLFTVPLNIPDKSAIMNLGDDDPLNLCFEVHGQDDAFFNLVSDGCVSVNAHYSQVRPNEDINIIDRIYVRASDTGGVCRNIEVSLDQCSASVDGTSVDNYMSAGISVRRYRNRVRIAVPNCDDIELVMWVFCLNTTFWSRASTEQNEIIFVAEMIRFVIARGLDLDERSHGIIGQFWNVPIQVAPYTGPVRPGVSSDGYYIITTNHPDEGSRQFIGWLWSLTWEHRSEYCLYAGQNQGGPLYEILDDTVNNWVIFGSYSDYRVNSAYDTDFMYSHFDETQCQDPANSQSS